MSHDELWIILTYFNHTARREKLLLDFLERLPNKGVFTQFVGGAPRSLQHKLEYKVTRAKYLTLDEPFWYKENLINVGASLLPSTAKYLAAVDADLLFADPDFAQKTVEALQNYDAVQMFREVQDLDESYSTVQDTVLGYVATKLNEIELHEFDLIATGHAWAFRRAWFEKVGGLCDIGPCMSGDGEMARSLFGRVAEGFRPNMPDGYRIPWLEWQEKVKGTKVGYVPGTVFHYWHGPREGRGYDKQWDLIRKFDYSPEKYLVRGPYGLWKYKEQGGEFWAAMKDFFGSRVEE